MNGNKKKIIIALKKARTSIDQILLEVESRDQKKCFDVIQQNLAAIGLLRSVNTLMLETHVATSMSKMSHLSVADKRLLHRLRDEIVRVVHTAQNK